MFLNKQKVYERVPSCVYGGLTVLSLDKSEGGIAKAMFYVRFLFHNGISDSKMLIRILHV